MLDFISKQAYSPSVPTRETSTDHMKKTIALMTLLFGFAVTGNATAEEALQTVLRAGNTLPPTDN